MSNLDKANEGRLNKCLNKLYRYNNQDVTLKEVIEDRINKGQYVFTDTLNNKTVYMVGTNSNTDFQGMNIPKIVYEFYQQEQEKRECKVCQDNKDKLYPSHFASNSCESGKRNHCTCDICF